MPWWGGIVCASRARHVFGQYGLDLWGPNEHYDLLHREQRGAVILWERAILGGKRWIKLKPNDPRIPEMLRAQEGQNDAYITPNEFDGWRLVRLLRSLRACYVDLDGCTDIEAVLDALSARQLPCPSFILLSGRGLHLYWLLEAVPAQALPVWQRIQDALIAALVDLGADSAAKDCTRLLRLAGTRNSKNAVEIVGHIFDGHRWSLRQLAFEVLGRDGKGRRPAEVRDLRAKRKGPDRAIQGSIYARWLLVFQDLIRISEHHRHDIPEGHRDKWLFLCGAALSWFTHPQGIAAEIASLGRLHTGLDPQEILSTTKPNLERAIDAAAGKKLTWNGQEVDPRYRFKRQTLYDWLSPIIPDNIFPELRAIVPDELARERRKPHDNRQRNRAAEGRYRDSYTKAGVRVSNQDKRAQAQVMRAQGQSYRQIAEGLGISHETARLWSKSVK
nr:DNA-primase RepB domain-containing protein [Acidithiobacillus caldus]